MDHNQTQPSIGSRKGSTIKTSSKEVLTIKKAKTTNSKGKACLNKMATLEPQNNANLFLLHKKSCDILKPSQAINF